MTPTSRLFPLEDVLSITTGMLLSLRGTDGLRDLLNYMTQARLADHQLPEAAEVCRPVLVNCYPALSETSLCQELAAFEAQRPASPADDAHYLALWLTPLIAQHGALLPVPRLPAGTTDFSSPTGDLLAILLDSNPHAEVLMLTPQEAESDPAGQAARRVAGRRPTKTEAEKVTAIDALLHELHGDLEQLHARYGRERAQRTTALADRLSHFVGDVRAVVRDMP
jgi:hypothetical protein